MKWKANVSESFDEPFVLAGLKLLEHVGDQEAIITVASIGKNGNSHALRQSARNCLAYLEIRRDELAVSRTLLRASNSNGQDGELLRAAAPTESLFDELLRSSHLP